MFRKRSLNVLKSFLEPIIDCESAVLRPEDYLSRL